MTRLMTCRPVTSSLNKAASRYPRSVVHFSNRGALKSSVQQEIRGSFEEGPLLPKFPYKLMYVVPCKCWQLQNYVHLNPGDRENKKTKGSLDSIIGDQGMKLEEDYLEMGEVVVSEDGLLHPGMACQIALILKQRLVTDCRSPCPLPFDSRY